MDLWDAGSCVHMYIQKMNNGSQLTLISTCVHVYAEKNVWIYDVLP